MRGLADLFVGGQGQAVFDELVRLRLAGVKAMEQFRHIGHFEVVGALFHFVLVVHVAIGNGALRADRPDQVEDVVDVLQVHAQALEAVGNLAGNRPAFHAAGLLEIGELGDFHAVQPHFPAQAPGAQGRRFPVVLDKTQVVHQRVDAQRLQRSEIALEQVIGVGLHHHLVLVVALQTVGIFAIAAIGRTAAGLDEGGIPRLRAERAQKGGGMEGAGADLDVERLDQHASLLAPVLVEAQDELLERGCRHGENRRAKVRAIKGG